MQTVSYEFAWNVKSFFLGEIKKISISLLGHFYVDDH